MGVVAFRAIRDAKVKSTNEWVKSQQRSQEQTALYVGVKYIPR